MYISITNQISYSFFYRYDSPTCTKLYHGFVDKGILKEVGSLSCVALSDRGWHFLKLSVSRSGDADVYVNSQKIGAFHSTFTTRGFGGVLVRNGFNNIAEFRNFDISPKLVDELLPPRGNDML